MTNSALLREDKIRASLCKLYEACGYRAFRMRKFEEYSLYLENQSFLTSKYVITFNDLDGRLLALKPDVTLSIVKQTKADGEHSEKLYYSESVYRVDKRTKEYKEIKQVGLELLGNVDNTAMLEVASLALKSLEQLDENYVVEFSHMGFLSDVLESIGVESYEKRREILECVGAKNTSGILQLAQDAGVLEANAKLFAELVEYCADYKTVLKKAKKLAITDALIKDIDELETLLLALERSGFADHIMLDFSIISDLDYYNGIVFRGYIPSVKHQYVLSGGRYDKLANKFKKGISALGFAIYVSELAPAKNDGYDVDVLLIYGDNDSPDAVEKYAWEMRDQGLSVLVEKNIPANITYKCVKKMEDSNA